MNITELFVKAVRSHLGTGFTQVAVAKKLGVSPQELNGFLNGRRNFSDTKKEQLANIFGKTYLEMLNLGYRLATGSEPDKPELPIELKDVVAKLERLDQDSLKIIDALADKLPKEDKQ